MLSRSSIVVARVAALLLALSPGAMLFAQDADLKIEQHPTTNPWTHLKVNNDPANFQFAIVSDRTGGHRPGVFEDAIGKLNLLQPEFVMSVGDLIEGYTHDEVLLDKQWDEFQSFTAQLKMPFFYVPGNHDVTNPTQSKKWAQRFGRDYYHFVYRNVLFICLNSEDQPAPSIGQPQREYVKNALDENKNVRWTLVFMHRPLWTTEDRYAQTPAKETPTGWLDIESMLRADGRNFTVFAGHNHDYMKFERQDRKFIILSTTGGGSALRGTSFGEFDHVVWATMTNEGPLLANLLLDGIRDENVATDVGRRRVDQLASSAKILVSPLLPDGDVVSVATLPLKLVNDANIPLRVSARFRPSTLLSPDPYAIETTVNPNSVETIDLKLQPRKSDLSVAGIAPLLLDATLTYEPEELPKMQLSRVIPVAIDHVTPVDRVASAVAVDGKLDEWPVLPYECVNPMQTRGEVSSWEGPDDASFKFATAYDDKFLYIAIDSTDERVVPMTSDDRRSFEDSIEVRIDARPAASRPARAAGRAENEAFLYLSGSPGDDAKSTFFRQADLKGLPEGTRFVSVKRDKGFVTEIAVPLSYLDKEQKAPWKDFRLNIAQTDRDDATGPWVQLHWRPDWHADEPFSGSGTFRKK